VTRPLVIPAKAGIQFCLFVLVSSTLTLALSGCFGSSPPLPDDHYYRLPIAAPTQRFEAPPVPGVIMVERPRATAVHATRSLAYSEDEQGLRLEHYHYHHWTDPPPQLLQQALVDFLRAANVAPTVTSDAGRLELDYRISAVVRRFERQKTSDGWKVAVTLELRADAAAGDRPLLLNEYAALVPVKSDDMEGTVRAFSAASGDVFTRFLADLASALPPPASSTAGP